MLQDGGVACYPPGEDGEYWSSFLTSLARCSHPSEGFPASSPECSAYVGQRKELENKYRQYGG